MMEPIGKNNNDIMSNYQLKTPVVFIIFNRPETTKKVFEKIKKAKPPKLLVIADGPRKNSLEDKKNCAAARKIIDKIDWDCEILKNYSNINLGLSKRVSSGLEWVFKNVNRAIILEDDCLPNPTFFRFCEELLEKYEDNEKIISITGQNMQFNKKRGNASYYFSKFFHCWGWATWKRAWNLFDYNMDNLDMFIKNGKKILNDNYAYKVWKEVFLKTKKGYINSWANRFMLANFLNKGLNIIPNVNLVTNIGGNKKGTNQTKKSRYNDVAHRKMYFPLMHPLNIYFHNKADKFIQRTLFDYKANILKRAFKKIFIYR